MFQIDSDMTIYITRGDIAYFTVTAENNGEKYKFQPGDIVRIKVTQKKNCDNVAFQKDFPVYEESDKVDILLTEEETRIGEVISKPVDYWYEIELNPYTNPQTIIGYDDDGAKIFKLFPEGRDLRNNEVEEEDIPVIDAELSMVSQKPVENQAITAAMVRLSAEIATERGRISKLANGEKVTDTLAAEIADVRVGLDGEVYTSAGKAVRGQLDKERKRAVARENEIESLFTVPTQEAVSKWLNEHPEATTTVQDNSLGIEKMVVGTLGYVTPQMFGAKGDGVTDDTQAFKEALENSSNIIVPDGEYLITDTLTLRLKTVITGINSPVIKCSKKLFESATSGYFLEISGLDIHVIEDTQDAIIDMKNIKYFMFKHIHVSNFTGKGVEEIEFTGLSVKPTSSFCGYVYGYDSGFSGKIGADLECTNASLTNCDLQNAYTGIKDSCEELNLNGCAFYNHGSETYIINNDYVHYVVNSYCEPSTTLNYTTVEGKLGKVVPLGGKYNYSQTYENTFFPVENNTVYGDTMLGVSGENLLPDNWGDLSTCPKVTTDFGVAYRNGAGYAMNIKKAVYLSADKEYTLSCVYHSTTGASNPNVNLTASDDSTVFYRLVMKQNNGCLWRTSLTFKPSVSGWYDLKGYYTGGGQLLDIYELSVCEGLNYANSSNGKVSAPSSLILKGADGKFYDISVSAEGAVIATKR